MDELAGWDLLLDDMPGIEVTSASPQTGVTDGKKSSEYSVRPVQVGRSMVCPLIQAVWYGPLQPFSESAEPSGSGLDLRGGRSSSQGSRDPIQSTTNAATSFRHVCEPSIRLGSVDVPSDRWAEPCEGVVRHGCCERRVGVIANRSFIPVCDDAIEASEEMVVALRFAEVLVALLLAGHLAVPQRRVEMTDADFPSVRSWLDVLVLSNSLVGIRRDYAAFTTRQGDARDPFSWKFGHLPGQRAASSILLRPRN